MTTLSRQNTLFVSEDWLRIYESLQNINFRAYDFESLVQAIVDYIKTTHPEDFNDYIASSEFIMHIEILAWLSQNLSYRIDLNTRENFLATAERRDSILKLANNLCYKVNRVKSASGFLRIESMATTQELTDSNGVNLQNFIVEYNDLQNEDWLEQMQIILNNAFIKRTNIGRPLSTFIENNKKTEHYVFNSYAPSNGVYNFTSNSNGNALDFEVVNGYLDKDTGVVYELAPNDNNALNLFFKSDGLGYNSKETGFFIPFKQGRINHEDVIFNDSIPYRTVEINSPNVNNDDIWVQKIQNNEVIEDWTKIDDIFGQGIAFNTGDQSRTVYEVDTLANDKIRIKFGDGSFGRIPQGNFRIWYRTCDPIPSSLKTNSIQNVPITIPYASNNQIYYLSMSLSLTDNVNTGAISETNFDIKTRANKFFYTQNRMVTSQDYNNFFLKDNDVKKVKTVNRTYIGHSKYSKLHDPTSLYENVKHYAEDGRIYQDFTKNIQYIEANTNIITINKLIKNYIEPSIDKDDKKLLYYSYYNEIVLNTGLLWYKDVNIAGFDRGRILSNNISQKVGTSVASTDKLFYVRTNSILRFDNRVGGTSTVDRIVEDGSANSGIWLKDEVNTNSIVYSVMPEIRNTFTREEYITFEKLLNNRKTFAISWNQNTLTYNVIDTQNIDFTSDFSIINQGNVSGKNKDSSWILLLEFVANTGNQPKWKITDRGLSLFFESAEEVDFIYFNDSSIKDFSRTRSSLDNVEILENNESRDSLRRRFIMPDTSDDNCTPTVIDGLVTTQCIPTTFINLSEYDVILYLNDVLQVPLNDYTITHTPDGDKVCFVIMPPTGSNFKLIIGGEQKHATNAVMRIVGDGNTNYYDIGNQSVNSSNTLIFWDGVFQNNLTDYNISKQELNTLLYFNDIIPNGVVGQISYFKGITTPSFVKKDILTNGTQTKFTIQTEDTSLAIPYITIDGVTQSLSEYSIIMNGTTLEIEFITAPVAGLHMRITAPRSRKKARVNMVEFTTNGASTIYNLSNYISLKDEQLIVSLDGVVQQGGWYSNYDWTIIDGNKLVFRDLPPSDMKITVYMLLAAVGSDNNDTAITYTNTDQFEDDSIQSCFIRYLKKPINLTPYDSLRHEDGYTNTNGLAVVPADRDFDGAYDNAMLFKTFVITDKKTDLVLWKKSQEYGFDVWTPINRKTKIKGTYGISSLVNGSDPAPSTSLLPLNKSNPLIGVNPSLNDPYDEKFIKNGDIHYNVGKNIWMVANGFTGKWEAVSDQTAYRFKIGRDMIKFVWTHYSLESTRIDPSRSNIMNVHILTDNYYSAFLNYLATNQENIEPISETTEQLKLQFVDMEEYKTQSDSIIYYPARFKRLFGKNSKSENRAIFKVVQTKGSNISETDLKLRILQTINNYFNVDLWEFGSVFYFTELSTYIHNQLAPDIQSIVIVPYNNGYNFGQNFQIRAESDELFISTASPTDIEIINTFNGNELRILNSTVQ